MEITLNSDTDYEEYLEEVEGAIIILRDLTRNKQCQQLNNSIYTAISILTRGYDAGVREQARITSSSQARLHV